MENKLREVAALLRAHTPLHKLPWPSWPASAAPTSRRTLDGGIMSSAW